MSPVPFFFAVNLIALLFGIVGPQRMMKIIRNVVSKIKKPPE
jgi:hypothetical protein